MPAIIELRNQIKNILEAIVQDDGTRKIGIVYNYPELKSEIHPYAYIDFKGDEETVLNNRQDRTNYTFEIVLIQEKIEDFKGREAAEDTTMERAYAIAEAFRENNDLGLEGVLRVIPLRMVKGYADNATRISLTTILEVQTIEDVDI